MLLSCVVLLISYNSGRVNYNMPIISCRRAAGTLVLVFSAITANADVKYPTETDVRGFQSLCAGGITKDTEAHVHAAVQAWRLKPGVDADMSLVVRDLGAVMEKIKQSSDAPLYLAYVDCVQNLILNYLHASNPAPGHAATQPSKP